MDTSTTEETQAIARKLAPVLESLEESDDVKIAKKYTVVITLDDLETISLSRSECRKLLQNGKSAKQLCEAIGDSPCSIELGGITIPDDAMYVLDEHMMVEEV